MADAPTTQSNPEGDFALPDDLAEIENPAELADAAAEALAELAEEARNEDGDFVPTDDQIAEAESLAAAHEALTAEVARRAEANAERASTFGGLLDRVAGPGDDATAEAADGSDDDDDDDDEATAETAATGAEAAATETAPAEPAVEAAVEAEPVDAEPVEAAAAAPAAKPTGSLERLTRRRNAAASPAPSTPAMRATQTVRSTRRGDELTGPSAVASLLAEARSQFTGNVVGREYLYLAAGSKAIDAVGQVGTDYEENFGVLRTAQTGHQALVASGGCCAPATPLYDFYRLAEPQNPVEDCLPTVQAPRGTIRYIVPPDFRDAFPAIGVITCAEDAAGYESQDPAGPTPDKPCVHVDCPQTNDCSVIAVSQCVSFGNLGHRVFPEQVEAFMEDVAVAFTLRKEALYLSEIDAASTAATGIAPAYGASRSLLFDMTTGAVAYRKRHNMRRGSMLQVLAPDWAVDLLKVDMAMDGGDGLNHMNVSDADVIANLRSNGLDICWYNDVADPGIAAAQGAGALNPWPTEVNWYLFSPGTFVRLDGGSLDVGLVRDSALNRTNDLELFMEEWTGLCMLGLESVKVTSTVCPSGARPDYVAALAC